MPTLRIGLPAYVSKADVEALRGDLAPCGYGDELPSASYDPQAVLPGISFVSNVLQSVEALANCLRRTPQGWRSCYGWYGGKGKTCDDHHSASDENVI